MKITELICDERSEAHIARHRVTCEEVEQVVFSSDPLILRTRNGQLTILGATEPGRRLFIVPAPLPDGMSYVITARDMSKGERRRWERR